jgi:hypothetical protein
MDIAIKKIEHIEWLARLQDEKMILQIEALRKRSLNYAYESRIPLSAEDVQLKLDRSEDNIKEGKVHTQDGGFL